MTTPPKRRLFKQDPGSLSPANRAQAHEILLYGNRKQRRANGWTGPLPIPVLEERQNMADYENAKQELTDQFNKEEKNF